LRLLAERPQLKVLYMSGYAGDGASHATRTALGTTEVLQKPFSVDALLQRVREVLDE